MIETHKLYQKADTQLSAQSQFECKHYACDLLTCLDCDKEFWTCEVYKSTVRKTMLTCVCKSCYLERGNAARRARLENPDEREKYNAYMRARTSSMTDTERLVRQLKTYDLTMSDLERMLKDQDGKCAICLEQFVVEDTQNGGRLHIDHKHGTLVVRGLLCPNCNLMLGHAKDKIETLMRAAQYLYLNEGTDEQ